MTDEITNIIWVNPAKDCPLMRVNNKDKSQSYI